MQHTHPTHTHTHRCPSHTHTHGQVGIKSNGNILRLFRLCINLFIDLSNASPYRGTHRPSFIVRRPSSVDYRASSIGIAYTPWLAMCMHKMYNKIVISVEHLLSAQIGRDKFEGVATGCRLWLWDLSLGLPAQLSINAVAWHGLAWHGSA